jgi:hypothetical protein
MNFGAIMQTAAVYVKGTCASTGRGNFYIEWSDNGRRMLTRLNTVR